MNCQQLPPPAYLKDYVRYFWVLESSVDDRSPKIFRPLADGCPGLLFQQSEQGLFYDQTKKLLPRIFLYGQTIDHTELHSTGALSTIGICFHPHALKAIFGLDANELTNTCLDVNLLTQKQGIQLAQQLADAPSVSAKINGLSAYLLAQIRKNDTGPTALIQYALTQFINSEGRISLNELQRTLNLSERSFERKFNQYVGISPKVFSRICQFQASLNQVRANKFAKLSDVAFDNAYADQSHFIRSFKEFAGLAPHQFQKRSHELIENFPLLIP
jgi:AraC-like DNA-binding protein